MITSALSFARWCSECNIELWADIPDIPHYQASNLGRYRSMPRTVTFVKRGRITQVRRAGKVLTPGKHRNGHLKAVVGRGKNAFVHQLVIAAFTGVWTTLSNQCRHLDGVPTNNRLYNLLPGTPAQNATDRVDHGRTVRGVRNYGAKLTEDDVRDIRWLAANSSLVNSDISQLFGVNRDHVAKIVNGKSWAHV